MISDDYQTMDWLIGETWTFPSKGLTKTVQSLHFTKVEKPSEWSECCVKFSNVQNLCDHPSAYLLKTEKFLFEMGSAVTPVDCYIEILVQNMLLGETSSCQIATKSGQPITFYVTLQQIVASKYLFQLTLEEMYQLAQKYRRNGVEMFKKYPKFAHDYFSRAIKLLISFKPFDSLTRKSNGVDGSEMEALLRTLQTNLAACLLQENRSEDVIHVTEFVDKLSAEDIAKMEKAVYRRGLAFYNIKAYDKALATIEKVENMQDKKEFINLCTQIKQMWKRDEQQYKNLVQRMFN